MSQSSTRIRDEPGAFVLAPSPPHPPPAPHQHALATMPPAGLPRPDAAGTGAWLIAWGEIVLLALLALVGAFFASADASPGDYACGMILVLAAIALAFLRLKARLDGEAGGWADSLLVDDWTGLTAAIVVFVLLGLVGLFVAAAHETGGLHNGGVALFVVSALAIFLNLKRVFDRAERGG
jgi:hypothetical protein